MDAVPDACPGQEKAGRDEGNHDKSPESRILPPGFPSHSSLCVSQCKNVSHEELMELQSVVGGLPCCVLKHIKAKEVLNDTEALMTISKRMKKAQLKALLQGVSSGRGGPSPPHSKMSGKLRCANTVTVYSTTDERSRCSSARTWIPRSW